jgi:magnesium transporter
MTRILRRRVIPGSPPGTLGAPAERRVETVTFRVMDYQADRLEEAAVAAVEELDGYLQRSDSVTWIDVVGLHDVALLSALGDKLCLHPLALEDVVNSHQRPKLEDYGEHSFVVLRLLRRQEGLASEQVSLFLGPGWVLTFQETPQDPFEPVRERLRRGRQRIRGSGSDYLAYARMDSLVDSFFPLLEHYGEQIEELEGELLARPERRSLERVHEIKKDLLEIRRATWPLREVINGFERQDISLVGEQTRLFLRDCYDHTIQLIDIGHEDSHRDRLDLHPADVSRRHLRHELQPRGESVEHAGAQLALGLPGLLGCDPRPRRWPAVALPAQRLALRDRHPPTDLAG